MEKLFLLSVSPDELKELIKSAIQEAIQEGRIESKNSIGRMDGELLDAKQAALFLKVKLSTIYSKTCKRLLPFIKRGKKIYFKKDELEFWLSQGKVKTETDITTEAANYCLKPLNTKKSWKRINNKNKKK